MSIRDGIGALVDGFRTFRIIPNEPYQDPREWVEKMMAESEARRLAHLKTLREHFPTTPPGSSSKLPKRSPKNSTTTR